jgi:hypothetical protein
VADRIDVDWEKCDVDKCDGRQLPSSDGRCWRHANKEVVDAELKRVADDRRIDGRGTTFNADLLQRILKATREDDEGSPVISSAKFSGATFTGDAWFGRATFERDAWFNGATFKCEAKFPDATFTGDASFAGATFERDALFGGATFKRQTWFDWATFECEAKFSGTTFTGGAWFHATTFMRNAWFDGGTFEHARQLGPMRVRQVLVLDGVLLRERVQIEVGAASLLCRHTRFLAGVQLRVRGAGVVLDGSDLAGPAVLEDFPGFGDVKWEQTSESGWPADCDDKPRLWSVRGADVAGLTVSSTVDLRPCSFFGAHHLDQLRAQGSSFAHTPPGPRAKRRIIAEEQKWRGWSAPTPSDWLKVEELTPERIATLYRELRKGLEDSKDEPGAADFYYGEMEMRRHAKWQQVRRERRQGHRGSAIAAAAEHAILWLYWLVSGYGLRAWRALASLAVVVLVASAIFAVQGFPEPDRGEFATALRFSTQATTALLRAPAEDGLTETGEWLQIALRLIGTVLLGLAVLSVRGRVKR